MDTTINDVTPTISMMPVEFPDGSFGVEMMLTGLSTLRQAELACEHMERMFCAEEIKAR